MEVSKNKYVFTKSVNIYWLQFVITCMYQSPNYSAVVVKVFHEDQWLYCIQLNTLSLKMYLSQFHLVIYTSNPQSLCRCIWLKNTFPHFIPGYSLRFCIRQRIKQVLHERSVNYFKCNVVCLHMRRSRIVFQKVFDYL